MDRSSLSPFPNPHTAFLTLYHSPGRRRKASVVTFLFYNHLFCTPSLIHPAQDDSRLPSYDSEAHEQSDGKQGATRESSTLDAEAARDDHFRPAFPYRYRRTRRGACGEILRNECIMRTLISTIITTGFLAYLLVFIGGKGEEEEVLLTG